VDFEASPENSQKVYESICEFFGTNFENLTKHSFTELNKIFIFGVAPNRIDIITSLPGVDFHTAWDKKNTMKHGKASAWIIDRESLEKNFQEVAKLEPKLRNKYEYFLQKLKQFEK